MYSTPPRIDWQNLSDALSFYERRGYRRVEVPWVVTEEPILATLPPGLAAVQATSKPYQGGPQSGFLVGSAEQSFLALEMAGRLPPGRYVALTPCFRDEAVIDDLHQPYFMKVELYRNDRVEENALANMVDDAIEFFGSRRCGEAPLRVVQTAAGPDIEFDGVEIGSYGMRSLPTGQSWVYGTGCAEPRLSTVLTRHELRDLVIDPVLVSPIRA